MIIFFRDLSLIAFSWLFFLLSFAIFFYLSFKMDSSSICKLSIPPIIEKEIYSRFSKMNKRHPYHLSILPHGLFSFRYALGFNSKCCFIFPWILFRIYYFRPICISSFNLFKCFMVEGCYREGTYLKDIPQKFY